MKNPAIISCIIRCAPNPITRPTIPRPATAGMTSTPQIDNTIKNVMIKTVYLNKLKRSLDNVLNLVTCFCLDSACLKYLLMSD